MVGQCQLCLKSEAEYIASKVVKKELTHQEASKELEVSLPDWIAHYELHVRNKLVNAISMDIEPIKKNLLDKIKEGTESMDRLITLTKNISQKLSSENIERNIKLIQTYATLERNVITGLKELAILEGDISTATTINIQNNTLKVDKIMSIVMEDAPEDFKRKLLSKLEAIPIAN